MLTTTYRPQTFNEIVGQDLNIEVLRAISKDPETAPKVLLFRGEFGTGKTTSARVFARALNCEYGRGEPCGDCPVCTQDIGFVPFYQEFDSSDVGNKESIQGLKDDFFVAARAVQWRVIVLDEFHLASKQAQAALLKVLEDMPDNLFFIICTTNVEKVLSTIRSRSVDLIFRKVPFEDLKTNLQRIVVAEVGTELDDDIASRICLYSRGHVRDSVMLLDIWRSVQDVDTFLTQIRSSELGLIHLLCSIKRGDKDRTAVIMADILTTPLSTLRADLYQVIQEALKTYAMGESTSLYKKEYEFLASLYKGDLLRLLGFSMSEWAVNSFYDDTMVQAFFWAAFIAFGKAQQKTAESPQEDRFRRK